LGNADIRGDVTSKLKLEPGRFYASRDGEVWCYFRLGNPQAIHDAAFCIRVSDQRVEYFYRDGRYDREGKREHTLVKETEYPK